MVNAMKGLDGFDLDFVKEYAEWFIWRDWYKIAEYFGMEWNDFSDLIEKHGGLTAN